MIIDRSMLLLIFAIVCARYSWAVQILIDRILLLWILIADPVCLEMVAVVTVDFSAARSGSHDAIEKAGHAEPNRNNQKHLEQRPRQRDRHSGGVGGGHAAPSLALCMVARPRVYCRSEGVSRGRARSDSAFRRIGRSNCGGIGRAGGGRRCRRLSTGLRRGSLPT